MTGSAHGGPADDNDVGGVFRVCVGVEESARSAPLMWGVFDEPLTDYDLLVLSRAFDFSDGLREHCVPAAWEALDSTLDSGVRELVSHPPRTEAELAAMGAYNERLVEAGIMLAGAGLISLLLIIFVLPETLARQHRQPVRLDAMIRGARRPAWCGRVSFCAV